jgi:hypothetical protein
MFLMDGNQVDAPASLIEAYPFLKKICKSKDHHKGQVSLF